MKEQAAAYKEAHPRDPKEPPHYFVGELAAGETVEEAIAAARALQQRGLSVTLDYLGESVRTIAEADTATRAYIRVFGQLAGAGIDHNISLKLTQLGLTVDRATCVDNLRRILDEADARQFFVRIDMEDSPFTAVTLWVSWMSASVSLLSTLPLTGFGPLSSLTALTSATATGPSLTPAIFTVAVAQLRVPLPSRMA